MRGIKRERIIRILLIEKQITKYRLAKLAKCSFPWVHEFLKLLEKKKLVKNTKVINKEKLINYWLSIHKKPRYREYMIQKPLELLKNIRLEYALTTYQADNLIQHFLFPSRTDIYIKKNDLNKWHTLLVKNGLYGKGNFRIIIYDEHVFYKSEKVNNYNVVSLPQLIFDLKKEGGVCGEAAERLLKRLKNV
ncbi:MAG: hypothetical protein AABW45_00350 [Nanoarchaeota archaeon]